MIVKGLVVKIVYGPVVDDIKDCVDIFIWHEVRNSIANMVWRVGSPWLTKNDYWVKVL